MTAPALYEIESSEGADGTMHPAEQLMATPHAAPSEAITPCTTTQPEITEQLLTDQPTRR
ncbi:hypothetical protein RKD37_000135 [Streptomyces ambofaciens]